MNKGHLNASDQFSSNDVLQQHDKAAMNMVSFLFCVSAKFFDKGRVFHHCVAI